MLGSIKHMHLACIEVYTVILIMTLVCNIIAQDLFFFYIYINISVCLTEKITTRIEICHNNFGLYRIALFIFFLKPDIAFARVYCTAQVC